MNETCMSSLPHLKHTQTHNETKHVQQHLVASICCYIVRIDKGRCLLKRSCHCVCICTLLRRSIVKILVLGCCFFFFFCSAMQIIRTLFRERASPGNTQEILTSLKINYHNTRASAIQPSWPLLHTRARAATLTIFVKLISKLVPSVSFSPSRDCAGLILLLAEESPALQSRSYIITSG